jgi:hypothetical protein
MAYGSGGVSLWDEGTKAGFCVPDKDVAVCWHERLDTGVESNCKRSPHQTTLPDEQTMTSSASTDAVQVDYDTLTTTTAAVAGVAPANSESAPTLAPLIVFLNFKSGGKTGERLAGLFSAKLGADHVFNLDEGGPSPGLEKFRGTPDLRIGICGGDG